MFWMSSSRKFLSGSQELSNKISWVLSEILYFNDSKFKISEVYDLRGDIRKRVRSNRRSRLLCTFCIRVWRKFHLHFTLMF